MNNNIDIPDASQYINVVKKAATQLIQRLPSVIRYEDLYSAGIEALVKGAHRFDPKNGVDFATYIAHRVSGAMLDELRSLDTISRDRRRAIRDGTVSENELPIPQLVDISAAAGVADESDTEEEIDKNRRLALLQKYLANLPVRLQKVVQLYFFENWTLLEIADHLGVTEARVCQLKGEAQRHLKLFIEQEEEPPKSAPSKRRLTNQPATQAPTPKLRNNFQSLTAAIEKEIRSLYQAANFRGNPGRPKSDRNFLAHIAATLQTTLDPEQKQILSERLQWRSSFEKIALKLRKDLGRVKIIYAQALLRVKIALAIPPDSESPIDDTPPPSPPPSLPQPKEDATAGIFDGIAISLRRLAQPADSVQNSTGDVEQMLGISAPNGARQEIMESVVVPVIESSLEGVQRNVALKIFKEGISQDETAAQLGLPIGVVRAQAMFARTKLQKALEEVSTRAFKK